MTNERMFYNSVYYIELEISSLCNRHCSYCPQSVISRKRELLPINIFEKVMKELKTIEFDGGIAFHQFNEPLLELNHLCECIKCARKYLPNARLVLYTNGDLLNPRLCKLLKKLGIDKFYITCQLDNNEQWDKDLAYKKVKTMKRKLHRVFGTIEMSDNTVSFLSIKLLRFIFKLKEHSFIGLKKYPTIFQIESTDFHRTGSNRLGAININAQQKTNERNCTYFCSSMIHGVHISYKGNAYLCCDCCEDTVEAKSYLLGSIYENSIFELFMNKFSFIKKYIEGETPNACIGCYWNQ